MHGVSMKFYYMHLLFMPLPDWSVQALCTRVVFSSVLFIPSSVTKLVNTVFWQRMNCFWYRLPRVVYEAIWGHYSSRTRDLLRLSRQTLILDTGILTGHSQLNRDLSIVCIINKQVSVKKGLKPQPDSYTHVVSLWSSSSRMVAGLWGHTLGEVCDDVTGHLQKILFVPFVCRISTESGEIQWEIHVWILIS